MLNSWRRVGQTDPEVLLLYAYIGTIGFHSGPKGRNGLAQKLVRLLLSQRLPRCVSTGPVVVRLAVMAI